MLHILNGIKKTQTILITQQMKALYTLMIKLWR